MVKKYSDAEAVSGLLNLVKMELGLGTDVGFTQVRKRSVVMSGLVNLVKMEVGLSTDMSFSSVRRRTENRK